MYSKWMNFEVYQVTYLHSKSSLPKQTWTTIIGVSLSKLYTKATLSYTLVSAGHPAHMEILIQVYEDY